MIEESGRNWIRYRGNDLLYTYWDLLLSIDQYIHKHNDLSNACYWAICEENSKHNEIYCKDYRVRRINTSWHDVVKVYSDLPKLQKIFGLKHYVGRGFEGNWGIHRHCYSADSCWNLIFFDEGSDESTLKFYRHRTSKVMPSIEYAEDWVRENEKGFKLSQSIELAYGDIVSINTWAWHSHKTTGPVTLFLSCLADTKPVAMIPKKVLARLDR